MDKIAIGYSSLLEIIEEATTDSYGTYTMDFNGSNLVRVAKLAAHDWVTKNPVWHVDESFLAGAIFQNFVTQAEEVFNRRKRINED